MRIREACHVDDISDSESIEHISHGAGLLCASALSVALASVQQCTLYDAQFMLFILITTKLW